MRTLRQLLREFWMPLILGVAWTAYNLAARPPGYWSLREALNIFGPTFFFLSWLGAQWHRVRKQQKVEADLQELRDGMRALQAPLLPCRVFFTLQIEAQDEDVKRVFANQPGYQTYGPDQPMPPPPLGLPNGMMTGRLHSTDGYVDYRDGHLEAAGITLPELPTYNTIHRATTHTVCRVSREALSQFISPNEPLCMLPEVTVEIYKRGRPSKPNARPDLVLSSIMGSAHQALRLTALDNVVFADFATPELAPTPADATGWSLNDISGAFLRFSLQFFYVDGVATLPRASWPVLRNLQLLLRGDRLAVAFSNELLASQMQDEAPSPRIVSGAVAPRITFEYEMTDKTFQAARNAVSAF